MAMSPILVRRSTEGESIRLDGVKPRGKGGSKLNNRVVDIAEAVRKELEGGADATVVLTDEETEGLYAYSLMSALRAYLSKESIRVHATQDSDEDGNEERILFRWVK